MVLGFLFIFGILTVLTTVHEFGHFVVARFFGVGVQIFSLGFGNILLKKKIGKTEYALSAIPFGGYVRMDTEETGSVPFSYSETIFSKKPVWQRMFIVFAGAFFNFLFGFFVLLSIALWYGIPMISSRIVEMVDGLLVATETGLTKVLLDAAFVSVGFGFLTLIPFQNSDGSHLLVLLREAIRKKPLSKNG